MKRSSDRIRTTHAGRLPVSPGLENLPVRLYLGEVVDPAVIAEGIAHGIRKQVDLGIDCVGDGESTGTGVAGAAAFIALTSAKT